MGFPTLHLGAQGEAVESGHCNDSDDHHLGPWLAYFPGLLKIVSKLSFTGEGSQGDVRQQLGGLEISLIAGVGHLSFWVGYVEKGEEPGLLDAAPPPAPLTPNTTPRAPGEKKTKETGATSLKPRFQKVVEMHEIHLNSVI